MTELRIVLVDHRALLVEPLVAMLGERGIVVTATAADAASAVLQVQRETPAVVVVSGEAPGAMEDIVPVLRALPDGPRVLVLDHASGVEDPTRLLAAIEAGADGYTTGRSGVAGLVDAIRTLATGGTVVPPDLLGPLLRGLIDQRREASVAFERLITLTPREREILLLVGEGLDHDGIADRLVISVETARTHVHRVLRKLGVGSRLEAVTLVHRHGLVAHLERVVEGTARP